MILYYGILWYIMVFVIQFVPWYTVVNHDTVPWYVMVLYHGLCFNVIAFKFLNIFIPIKDLISLFQSTYPPFQAVIAGSWWSYGQLRSNEVRPVTLFLYTPRLTVVSSTICRAVAWYERTFVVYYNINSHPINFVMRHK